MEGLTRAKEILSELYLRYPILLANREQIEACFEALCDCFSKGGRLYICGNGGSAADAMHIVGELMKSFMIKRPFDAQTRSKCEALYPGDDFSALEGGLPALALIGNGAFSSAFANDARADMVFAQQVYCYGRADDILLCISTSGNARNVINAAKVANAMGLTTLALTGGTGGELKQICSLSIIVAQSETFQIQELHLPVYHALCGALEARFFG